MTDWRLSPPQPIDFISTLTVEVCRERLLPKLKSLWLLGWPVRDRGMVGWLKGTEFYAMKHIQYANPFQTLLSATLLDEGGQTSIRCRFGLLRPTLIYFGLFLATSTIISLYVTVSELFSMATRGCHLGHGDLGADLSRLLLSLIFPVLVLLFIRVCRLFAKGEREYLVDSVCSILDARPTEHND